jgi:hypothetical protein
MRALRSNWNGDVESLSAAPAGSLRARRSQLRLYNPRPTDGVVEATSGSFAASLDAQNRRKRHFLWPPGRSNPGTILHVATRRSKVLPRQVSLIWSGIPSIRPPPFGMFDLEEEGPVWRGRPRPRSTPVMRTGPRTGVSAPHYFPCEGSGDVAASTSTCKCRPTSIPGG